MDNMCMYKYFGIRHSFVIISLIYVFNYAVICHLCLSILLRLQRVLLTIFAAKLENCHTCLHVINQGKTVLVLSQIRGKSINKQ